MFRGAAGWQGGKGKKLYSRLHGKAQSIMEHGGKGLTTGEPPSEKGL